MFIFCPRRQKTNQKNAAWVWRGFVREKAASRIFSSFNILLPHDPQPPAVGKFKNYLLNLNYLKSKKLSLWERSASPTN